MSKSIAVSPGDDSSDRPELNESNQAMLRNMIFQKLDEIRTGNAYVEHELNPDSFSKLLTDDNIYSKFEIMLGKNWMDVELLADNETGLNGGKLNKKKKLYINAIKAESDFVKTMIEQYTANSTSPRVVEKKGGRGDDNEEVDSVSSLSESKVSSSSLKRKKKSKKHKKKKQKDKKKARKSKKRKRDHNHSSTDESSDADMGDSVSKATSLTDKGRDSKYEERKASFEKEKKKVLDSTPDYVKKQFKQLGFAKWSKEYLPVMFLGPYDVAPGAVRDCWFQMKEKVRKLKYDNQRDYVYCYFYCILPMTLQISLIFLIRSYLLITCF